VDAEQTFRVILFGLFLIVLPIGLYHRIRSQTTGEKLDRKQEGAFILATLRPIGAIFWFGTIAWMIEPRWMAWAGMPAPIWLRWIGVGLMLIGAALVTWTFRSIGRNLTDTVVTRKQHRLVVSGPYRWVRHPLYTSVAVLTTAISLVTANWFLLASGLTAFGLLVVRTRTEERNLLARFGADYRQYMERTGRFLPGTGAAPRGR
jgi:protein-S-isoprenylcysteine O-methyltransferase Ste14